MTRRSIPRARLRPCRAIKSISAAIPFLSLGDVQMPMSRSRVVTTLSSSLASTKIVNLGGPIGTITGDHLTAVTGKLGASPAMVPLDLSFVTWLGREEIAF